MPYLWLAGEGPERANLEDLAQKLGIPRVRFGVAEDPEALYATNVLYARPGTSPWGTLFLRHGRRVFPFWLQTVLGRAR